MDHRKYSRTYVPLSFLLTRPATREFALWTVTPACATGRALTHRPPESSSRSAPVLCCSAPPVYSMDVERPPSGRRKSCWHSTAPTRSTRGKDINERAAKIDPPTLRG